MVEKTRIRCHVCGCITDATHKGVAQHNDKSGKRVCYGSFAPLLTGSKGEILPGELIYRGRSRFDIDV